MSSTGSRRTALDLAHGRPEDLLAQDAEVARKLDADATSQLGIPSILLMENAARAVAELARAEMGAGDALVLAGKGNNGGDGLAAARLLSPRAKVALIERPDATSAPDAVRMLQILEAAGVPVVQPEAVSELDALTDGVSLVIDALFGTGLERSPSGRIADWIRWAGGSGLPILSVDIPSGLGADGIVYEPCIKANWTVTFARPKEGLMTPFGQEQAGEITVATIGIPEDWVERWETA